MKVFSVAAALLALTAIVSAQEIDKRLVDISDTELIVKEVHDKPNVDTFVVAVQRTDDLLDDDGTFLAERVMSVAFNFDVQNHEVLINKVPLPLGSDDVEPITVTMTVEAGVVVGPAVDPETNVDDLMEAFDTGLVTVQVTATSEFITTEDGIVIRHVTLQETIVEVNGLEIVQTNAAQQLLEIMPDGSLGKYTPLTFGNKGCQGKLEAARQFFRSIHWPALLVAGLVSLSMFVVTRRIVQKRRQARYAQIQQDEEFVQVAVVDDKKDDEKKALV